jgi:hypothetical protein
MDSEGHFTRLFLRPGIMWFPRWHHRFQKVPRRIYIHRSGAIRNITPWKRCKDGRGWDGFQHRQITPAIVVEPEPNRSLCPNAISCTDLSADFSDERDSCGRTIFKCKESADVRHEDSLLVSIRGGTRASPGGHYGTKCATIRN